MLKVAESFVMATLKIILDSRKVKPGNPLFLRLVINNRNTRAYITLDAKLFPDQWDKDQLRVINHPNEKQLNLYLSKVKQHIEHTIYYLTEDGQIKGMFANDIKAEIERRINPEKFEKKKNDEEAKNLFLTRFLKFANSKTKSTCGVYMQTYRRMVAFAGKKLDRMRFEDVTKDWLISFDKFMAQTAPSKNARNIHLRNIRAVFNDAIDDEITTYYPFRRLDLRPVATAKRNLKVEELRKLFSYPAEEHALYYLDILKLMFLLIGINSVDLCRLKEIVDGRLVFNRAKTHRLYSIKVEPEAMEIIEKHRGNDWLIDVLDRYTDHNDFTRRMNKTLQKIGPVKRVGRGGKKIYDPIFPKLTTYWVRHSWATIAMSIDISKDVISHALGHGNNTVTDIYIEFDQSKVDEANRKVIDWVFYGKK